jgi:hypothetical protein
MRHAYKVVVGKAEEKRPFWRPRSRWDNKLYLKETGCENVNWIRVDKIRDQWRALVKMLMNFKIPHRRKV